jgi:DNA-binding transcriptional LysR family regulator
MWKQSRSAPSLDLAAVTAFAAVVDHRAFGAAAASLGIARSVMSKRVARLEKTAGVRLLERTTRRVALTEAGAALYVRCAKVLAAVAEAEAELDDLHGAPRGTLRISVPSGFGATHVVPLLPGLLARCPDLRLDVVINDRFVNLLEEGFDAAVRIGARLADSSLVARRLGSVAVHTCASPAYLASRGLPRRPRELLGHECLRFALMTARAEWVYRGKGGRTTGIEVAGRMMLNDGAALLEAAIAGAGVAKLPSFVARDALASGALVAVLEDRREPDLGVWVVHPAGRAPQPKVRAFVDYLAASMPARLAALACVTAART